MLFLWLFHLYNNRFVRGNTVHNVYTLVYSGYPTWSLQYAVAFLFSCIPYFGHLNWSSFYSCSVLSVSRQECRVKTYNANGKNVCEILPHIHAWLLFVCESECTCIYCVRSLCVSKSLSTCSLTSLPSRQGDMRIEPSVSLPLARSPGRR